LVTPAEELGTQDREDAWRLLRGYLHALRDRLTVDEGAQLAAQFPHLVRGVFYEGFDPGHQPQKIRDRDAFLQLVAERAHLSDSEEAGRLATAGTAVLRHHVSEGEVDDVLAQLPTEIRETLEGG
jgi:uncharacterized protein (DUF2267 family)